MHFIQPDRYAFYGSQGLNRFSYVFNRPVVLADPSGNNPKCGPDGIYCNTHIERPSEECRDYEPCWNSYLTFRAVTRELGYVPDTFEIMYMTMGAEAFNATWGDPTARAYTTEGMARTYFEICGTDDCQGNELYFFLAAYEAWFGVTDNRSQYVLAGTLVDNLRSDFIHNMYIDINDHSAGTYPVAYGPALRSDILSILIDPDPSWTLGMRAGEPWNWYGAFYLNPDANIPSDAFLYPLYFDDGRMFWVMDPSQNVNFIAHRDEWVLQETEPIVELTIP